VIKEGDKAPDFSLLSDSGARMSLKDFGGRALVLYFYPRDSTPGCTREAQAFSAAKRAIEVAGGAVVGVSRDSVKSHQSFRDKCELSIPLLSDPDLTVHKAYGAFGEKTMYGKKVLGTIRSTFLVLGGRVVRVWPSVRVDGHAEAVLQAIGELSSGGPSSRRMPEAATARATKKLARAKKAVEAAVKKVVKKAKATVKKAKATVKKARSEGKPKAAAKAKVKAKAKAKKTAKPKTKKKAGSRRA
jgi:thioredoxin-dependent peroxiredoxin